MQPIQITQSDYKILRELLARAPGSVPGEKACQASLFQEITRARVMPPSEIGPDIITLNCKAVLTDLESGERLAYTLVLPEEADVENGQLSILAPLGTAMIGFRKGDIIEWVMPGGLMKLRVEEVIPAANRHARKEPS